MTCRDCEPKELIDEGKAFLASARALCKNCPKLNTSCCGCIKISIQNNQLTKSKCPDGKW